jgi:ribosomal protein L25 (general stress protein Ctc)
MSKVKMNYKRPIINVKLLPREAGSKKNLKNDYAAAVIFGPEITQNLIVQIAKKDLQNVFNKYGISGKNCDWQLEFKGEKYSAVIKDMTFSLLDNRNIEHVDFYVPMKNKPFEIEVYPQLINPLVKTPEKYEKYPALTKNLAGNSFFFQENAAKIKITSDKIPLNLLVDINQLKNGETVFLDRGEFIHKRQNLLRVSG